MLKFSANLSVLFTEMPFMARFKAAKENGFEAVEIQFPYQFTPEKIKQALNENDLKLVLFNVDADKLLEGSEGLAAVPEKQAQFAQALEQTCRYAELLQPNVINVLAGRCFDEHKKSLYLNTFQQNLQRALDAFSPLGIKTVFEAINTYDMPQFLVHNSQQMLEILSQINHPDLLMQYDIYHMYRMGDNCADFIQQHAAKIGHLQFADAPLRGEPNTGDIDFKTLFSAIESSNYQGWLGAEYKPTTTTLESFSWR